MFLYKLKTTSLEACFLLRSSYILADRLNKGPYIKYAGGGTGGFLRGS